MTSAVMSQLAEKSKLKIARAPLSFRFSSLLFLTNLASRQGEVTEVTRMCKDVNRQVTLLWLKVHAVDVEVRASFLRQI